MSLGSIQLTPINLRGTPTNTGTGTGTGTESESESGTGFSNNDNTSSERTPTNSGQLDNNGHFRVESSNRWGAIPEEDSSESQIGDSFNLRSSAEASKRLETIRNDMIQNARITFEELKLDVEEPVRQINLNEIISHYIYIYIFLFDILPFADWLRSESQREQQQQFAWWVPDCNCCRRRRRRCHRRRCRRRLVVYASESHAHYHTLLDGHDCGI